MGLVKNMYINTWEPSGDYGSNFKTELTTMKNLLDEAISDLSKYKKELEINSNNTKLTKESIELVEAMIKKLEHSQSNITMSIASIRLYDGGE